MNGNLFRNFSHCTFTCELPKFLNSFEFDTIGIDRDTKSTIFCNISIVAMNNFLCNYCENRNLQVITFQFKNALLWNVMKIIFRRWCKLSRVYYFSNLWCTFISKSVFGYIYFLIKNWISTWTKQFYWFSWLSWCSRPAPRFRNF